MASDLGSICHDHQFGDSRYFGRFLWQSFLTFEIMPSKAHPMEQPKLASSAVSPGDEQSEAVILGRAESEKPVSTIHADEAQPIQLEWAGVGAPHFEFPDPCPACRITSKFQRFVKVMNGRLEIGGYARCVHCQSLRAMFASESLAAATSSPHTYDRPQHDEIGQFLDLLWQLHPTYIQSYCEFGPEDAPSMAFARQALGWQARGIDLAALKTALAEPHRLCGHPYDAIAAFHVIERHLQPDAVLALMKACMGAWSCLLLSTPEAFNPHLHGQNHELALRTLSAPHLRPILFSLKGLNAALARADFPWIHITQSKGMLIACAAFARPPARNNGPLPQARREFFLATLPTSSAIRGAIPQSPA